MSAALERHPFIFSDARNYRVKRHVTFWFTWWIFQSFLYSFIALGKLTSYPSRLFSAVLESFVFLVPHMFLAYSLMYFVLPRFVFKERYWAAFGWVAIFGFLTAGISGILSVTIIEQIRLKIHGYDLVAHTAKDEDDTFHLLLRIHLALMAGFRGAITIGGMAAAIKLMKFWYVKDQRNMELQNEKSEAQLQLLKAQIHPHFFFNTLNNIYSLTQNTSKPASELVLGLSDMLRYMLYETNQALVPLQKELVFIEQYVALQTIRYGNKLDTHISFSGPTDDYLIAPLLLIPFVENSYKHGCSQMIESPWISLQIAVQENGVLFMKLLNSKPETDVKTKLSGIGIDNVKKRLELLYPMKHHLEIISEEEVFIVNLSLELEKNQQKLVSPKMKEAAYDLA